MVIFIEIVLEIGYCQKFQIFMLKDHQIIGDNIAIELVDHNVTALLDTGATVSVIGSQSLLLIHIFNLKITPIKSKTIRTADYSSVFIEGFVDYQS